jgi:Leucine-rich repeat (LRR) protein
MKFVIFSGIFLWCLANSSAAKTITCKKETIDGHLGCRFSGVSIGPNETVSIKTDPENADPKTITRVDFSSSSIHSVPSEVFAKSPNLKEFWADNQNVQEIKVGTFLAANLLDKVRLRNNKLTVLHRGAFDGKNFHNFFFQNFFQFHFKGLTRVTSIWVEFNSLRAIHPQTFSRLSNLQHLDFQGNSCITKYFNPIASLTGVENELMTCGVEYAMSKVENLESSIHKKFDNLQTELEEREKKVDRKFELVTELFGYLDERNEENAGEIKDIKKMVEKIWDMLNSK